MAIRKTISADSINNAIQQLAQSIASQHQKTERLLLLGIANGGLILSQRLSHSLSEILSRPIPHGTLDISFNRDDHGINPIPKEVTGTQLPIDLEAATVILVDDVLSSGRTTRAALEEIFSHGRPESVELAILVDRQNLRLPFAARYIGFTEETEPAEEVHVFLDLENSEKNVVKIGNLSTT